MVMWGKSDVSFWTWHRRCCNTGEVCVSHWQFMKIRLVPRHFRSYLSRKLGYPSWVFSSLDLDIFGDAISHFSAIPKFCSYRLFESEAQHLGPLFRTRALRFWTCYHFAGNDILCFKPGREMANRFVRQSIIAVGIEYQKKKVHIHKLHPFV